tara:strand:- start:110 stop:352 length:243 start_codon:yes stop_codon:yes gene_type:complete
MTREKTQFEQDWEQVMIINGMESNKGYYNLIVTIRDIGLWTKGIKPNRHFRLKDVKSYFGITGSAETMLQRLKDFRDGNL